MNPRLTPHTEILPPSQRQLWPELAPALKLGFVLYGGTAIALRLGHRMSVDFDFFCERPLDRAQLEMALPFLTRSEVLLDRRDTLNVLVPYAGAEHSHVKVSLFGSIYFGRVGEPSLTEDGVMQVASLDDLMATKLKVILQRIEVKDYRDIAHMIASGVDLGKGLASARALFGKQFQPAESLKALVYFEGGDLHELSREERGILVDAVSAVRDLPQVEVVAEYLRA